MAKIGKVISLIQGVTGTPGYAVHYFTLAGSVPSAPEATDITGRVRAMWVAVATTLAQNLLVVVDPVVNSYDDASGAITGSTGSSPTAGVASSGSGELPPMSMLGLQLNTGVVAGRRLLAGRTFIGPLCTAASTTGGIPTSTARTAVNTGGNALLTGATSSKLVVWARPKGGVANGISFPVTSVDCALKFWSLRSRRD